jgi:rhodanese-related sulfurtransferase
MFTGCRNNNDKTSAKAKNEKQIIKEEVKIDEFNLLITYLEKNGNFINSSYVPAMIGADKVKENIGKKDFLIIDIRKADSFNEGHIKGAVNVKFNELIPYFENDISPQSYQKIVMVCYSGQSASFAAGILNLLGYDNVYAMKFGMSAWGTKDAKTHWLKNISDKYINQLELKENSMNTKGNYPELFTGETDALAILQNRAQAAFDDSFKSRLVSAEEVFNNPDRYYIINYWPKDHYLEGHLPGAIQYTPKKSLSTTTFLNTLPTDKPIVIYCFTGQHASFVAAFLNTLGYDARVLKYGANSFMHSKLLTKKWHPFSKKKIHNYKVVKTELAY